MTVIGICGGSGSGKSTLVHFLTELNYSVFESDEVYHKITSYYSDCVKELEQSFGESILNPDKSLNRRALSKTIYDNGELDKGFHKLNQITHKYVQIEFLHWLNVHENEKILFLEAPLLYEANMDRFCDAVVAVITNQETQLQRITSRDHISKEQAKGRVSNQLSNEELMKKATYVIHNDGWIEDMTNEMKRIIKDIEDKSHE